MLKPKFNLFLTRNLTIEVIKLKSTYFSLTEKRSLLHGLNRHFNTLRHEEEGGSRYENGKAWGELLPKRSLS